MLVCMDMIIYNLYLLMNTKGTTEASYHGKEAVTVRDREIFTN